MSREVEKYATKTIKGMKVHAFTALKPVKGSKEGLSKTQWHIKCECGSERIVGAIFFYHPDRKTCGCSHINDITNQRFGMLTAIKRVERKSKTGCYIWECLCDFGQTTFIPVGELTRKGGSSKSCGCQSIRARFGQESTAPGWNKLSKAEKRRRIKAANPHLRIMKTDGTGEKTKFKCRVCKNQWEASTGTYYTKRDCKFCSPKGYSRPAIEWLEYLSSTYGIEILHAENGGEVTFKVSGIIPGKRFFKPDGYHAESNTAFEFDGDGVHGNLKLFKPNSRPNKFLNKTAKQLNKGRLKRIEHLTSIGLNVVSIWASDFREGVEYSEVHKGNRKKIPIEI